VTIFCFFGDWSPRTVIKTVFFPGSLVTVFCFFGDWSPRTVTKTVFFPGSLMTILKP
jgi:hypothetical protein